MSVDRTNLEVQIADMDAVTAAAARHEATVEITDEYTVVGQKFQAIKVSAPTVTHNFLAVRDILALDSVRF